MRFKKLGITLLCAAALVVVAVPTEATPIVYEAQLFNGVPVLGTNTQPASSSNNPEGANYFFFFADAGSTVNVFGDRLNGAYDMAFWILPGLFADTTAFAGSLASIPGAIIGDDEDAPNVPGPFGDPNRTFSPLASGFYTVAVTNFLSDPTTAPLEFSLQANIVSAAVPEPASMLLLGTGLAVLAVRMRRRKNA